MYTKKDLEHLKAGDEITIKATVRNQRNGSSPFVDAFAELCIYIDDEPTIVSFDDIVSVPERPLSVGDKVCIIRNPIWTDCTIAGEHDGTYFLFNNVSKSYSYCKAEMLERISQ